MPQRGEELRRSREQKLARLRADGVDPYPPRFRRTHTTTQAIRAFEAAEQAKTAVPAVRVGGRMTRLRSMGRASFVDILDGDGHVQLFLRQDALGTGYALIEQLDLGDFVGAAGAMVRTRMGEVSVEVTELTLLAKAMRPPPEKFHGLQDTEKRYRQRYLDLIANREVLEVARTRARVIGAMRRFLDARGFLEVETPVLVPVPAGAMAQPFVTHHNALDRQLYLRIATELYLKRLIVGGIDKVYEIGRVFRNEGIDQDHNPEFTLLESYEAYADYHDVMQMVEEMVPALTKEATGRAAFTHEGQEVSLVAPWPQLDLHDAVREHTGIDLDLHPDARSLADRMRQEHIAVTYAESRGKLVDKLVGTYVEPRLVTPTFLVNYPVEMSPLAKESTSRPGYAERFEAFAGGMEIANAFTELNDPAVQRLRLEEQEWLRKEYQGEDSDRLDEDFITALEHGMPPTGGLGMGIDRLVMLIARQPAIRDVVLFPQVRTIE